MREYITRVLMKEINEAYYRKYQETEMYALDKYDTEVSMDFILHEVPETDKELKLLLKDLKVSKGYIVGPYESKLGIELQERMMKYTMRIAVTLEQHLPVMGVIQVLKDNTDSAYLVGGAVRDIITNKTVSDFDFCTDTPIEDLIRPFEEAGYKAKTDGLEFLVLNVAKNGEHFEIANFRKDSDTSDGRRPDYVVPSTIENDAARRDFAVNALYFDIVKHDLLDPNGMGLEDIQTNTLRFIGKPINRLREDYIRAFRFMKFVKRGYIPDAKSQRAIKTHFGEIMKKSNPERILTEFVKMGLL